MLNRSQVVVAFLLAVGLAALARAGEWKEFRSSKGFSVKYPGTWFQNPFEQDRLDLLSSKGVQKGVVIKKGEANIVVMEMQGPPGATLDRLIAEEDERAVSIFGDSILSRADIRSKMAGERGCRELKEVVSRDAAVSAEDIPPSMPVPYQIFTAYYCEIKGQKFSTSVLNWEGDKQQKHYQQVALRIAKSIRISQ